jgi:hypothetical protein|tara:strand:- start:31 stop:525 length:495 start_codon:yes stop_codon:yes gene_type:complete
MIPYSIDEYYKDIKILADRISIYSDEVKSEYLRWDPDLIIAIARGGCVPGVYLSHLLDKPLEVVTWQTRDGLRKEWPNMHEGRQVLLVDDINDSGLTFKQIHDCFYDDYQWDSKKVKQNVKTASLWERAGSQFNVDFYARKVDTEDWIVFPWELPPKEEMNESS